LAGIITLERVENNSLPQGGLFCCKRNVAANGSGSLFYIGVYRAENPPPTSAVLAGIITLERVGNNGLPRGGLFCYLL
jgi:hypothetical protein